MKIKGIRVFILVALVIVVICGFTLRLMRYQITDGASYRLQAARTTVESIPIVAPRGEILDRNGNVLATNTVGYSVIIERAAFPKLSKENDTILELTEILSKNNEQWADTLPISKTAPYSFTANSDADITYLKSLLKIKTGAKLSASTAMSLLEKRYSIGGGYTQAQVRTIEGVRFEMDRSGFSIATTYTFATNVDLNVINQISERSIPGIQISQQYSRIYPDGTLAPQVIGNVGPIYADQYQKLKKQGYSLNDIVGKSGIEDSMESYLHGSPGMENVEIDTLGNITNRSTTKTPKPGDNVELTIDSGLQSVLQQSLQNDIATIVAASGGSVSKGADCKAGAAVVLNIKTGEVLAMASYPGYDNNSFYQDYSSLRDNPGDPLLNRAVQSTYRPGSTYKPVVATSALMNNVITKDTVIDCNGSYSIGTWTGGDDGSYGPIKLIRAITVSSNVFFYTTATRLSLAGPYLLENTARALGLGQLTGIELPNEAKGTISGPTLAKEEGISWNPADPAQSGIGQLYNEYTPLQLAAYIGGVVNGGTRYQVHIVKSVKSYDNTKTVLENTPKVVSNFKIPQNYVDLIKQGMYGVTVEGGTAGAVLGDVSLQMGGKTGTTQLGTKQDPKGWDGLFIGFAPYNNPQIVVAVAVENANWGYQTAYVARDVFNYMYLNNPDQTSSPLPLSSGQLIH